MATLIFGLPMAKTSKRTTIKKAGLQLICGLAFFFLLALSACQKQERSIELVWNDQQATGISIPKQLIQNFSAATTDPSIKVVLANGNKRAILGKFSTDNSALLFEPLIPLTPGLTYHILQNNQLIGQVLVPFNKNEKAPELLAIYPQLDTLPENLLKFYIHFSKPMRSGESLQFIHLLDKKQDTIRNVFLNLQPELWDTSSSVLTLWLDPGRIKRGLTLNRALGNPLKMNETYHLVISSAWKGQNGLKLAQTYRKTFVAGKRDDLAPDLKQWQLQVPVASTTAPLEIKTRETLDHYLLNESIGIVDQNNSLVKGKLSLDKRDQQVLFVPAKPWKAQRYRLQVDARLEDLAGNNLNRVFDRDITKSKSRNKSYYELGFEVKP
ncbi:Ig-like domain-containing protein [Haliscomenobacter sp.]|uniref:Ig-like domain-containing protein n=1 Tax=Haliscomenobacter sp. TaxID=2717303 RepID=UPI003BAD1475